MHKFLQGVFLAYVAILPIAETIALRNVLLLVAVIVLGYFSLFRRETMALSLGFLTDRRFIPLWIWALFLMLFPLWAQEPSVAWRNLTGQWGQAILAWFLGMGVAMVCGTRGPGVGLLALASGVILLIHLSLTTLVWLGALGSAVPSDLPVSAMLERLRSTWLEQGEYWIVQPFPWWFRGFDPMHGNLGYSSSQAIGLLSAFIFVGWLDGRKWITVWGCVAVALCLFSVVVAHSRGALLFDLALLVLGGWIAMQMARQGTAFYKKKKFLISPAWIVSAVVGTLVILLTVSIKSDARWSPLLGQARVAWMVPDPVDFLCKGTTDELRGSLKSQLSELSPAYADSLIEGLEHDGVRVILMRAGWRLVLEQPGGLDGSRHSFKKLLASRCGQEPIVPFAHSHNGWFDTALALGWGGAILLCCLFVYLAVLSWRKIHQTDAQSWALALLLLSLFWLSRGVLDSVYREHYLQMQGAVLGYLLVRLLMADGERVISG